MRTVAPLRTLALATAFVFAVGLTGCASDDLTADSGTPTQGAASAGGPVTIASQDFPEAEVVTAMYEELLDDAGYDVTTKLVGTRAVYMADFPGSIDIVPEYIAGISDYLNTEANGADAESITTADAKESVSAAMPLLAKKGITLLQPSPAFSANAYFVKSDVAKTNGWTKLSDLEGTSVVLAAAPDCKGRADCEAGLKEVYGINITELLPLGYAAPQTYEAVISREADLGQTGSTDGTLAAQGLMLLEDDRGIQPAQNLVPAVSSKFLAAHDDIEPILNGLMAALDNEKLGELVARVTVDREKPADVAEDFLIKAGLL